MDFNVKEETVFIEDGPLSSFFFLLLLSLDELVVVVVHKSPDDDVVIVESGYIPTSIVVTTMVKMKMARNDTDA
jgi:hypothetical protein